MIPAPDFPRQPEDDLDFLDRHLVVNIQKAYCPIPHLEIVDATIAQAITTQTAQQQQHPRRITARWPRVRLLAPSAVLTAVLIAVGAYFHIQSANPASAQSVLQQAQTAGLVPNAITQFDYRVTSSAGFTDTNQFWVQADGAGQAVRFAVAGAGSERNAAPIHLMGIYAAFRLLHLGPSSLDGSWLKGQQTRNGVPVTIVQEPDGSVLYFGSQDGIERGAEWTENGTVWHAQLLDVATVPASTVPTGAWLGSPSPQPRAALTPSPTSH